MTSGQSQGGHSTSGGQVGQAQAEQAHPDPWQDSTSTHSNPASQSSSLVHSTGSYRHIFTVLVSQGSGSGQGSHWHGGHSPSGGQRQGQGGQSGAVAQGKVTSSHWNP